MTIQKAILAIATEPIAATLNPKAQVSLRQIAQWQRRGEHDAKQDQAADNVAFYLTAEETEKVFSAAKALRG